MKKLILTTLFLCLATNTHAMTQHFRVSVTIPLSTGTGALNQSWMVAYREGTILISKTVL